MKVTWSFVVILSYMTWRMVTWWRKKVTNESSKCINNIHWHIPFPFPLFNSIRYWPPIMMTSLKLITTWHHRLWRHPTSQHTNRPILFANIVKKRNFLQCVTLQTHNNVWMKIKEKCRCAHIVKQALFSDLFSRLNNLFA